MGKHTHFWRWWEVVVIKKNGVSCVSLDLSVLGRGEEIGELWHKKNWSAYYQNCYHTRCKCDKKWSKYPQTLKQISPRITQESTTTHMERSIKNPWVTHCYALTREWHGYVLGYICCMMCNESPWGPLQFKAPSKVREISLYVCQNKSEQKYFQI